MSNTLQLDSRIWLSSPHMSGHELQYIQEAFDQNWVAPAGHNIDAFENSLQQYLGGQLHVAALNSGTAALHLALKLLGVKQGDFVICQSLTFIASANPVIYLGARPLFIDSEPDTWNLDPQAVEDAVNFCIKRGKKPAAIIAVSLYGMPYKADEINEIAKKYGIPVVEDSAEALGSYYKERPAGTLGDISVLSFNGNKIITTSGGGALVTAHKDYRDKAVYLSTQAKENTPYYEHTEVGYNYRMSNISAGIGRGQMEVLEDRIAARRKNHEFYSDIFKNFPEVGLFREPSEDFFSNHWLSAITLRENRKKITPETLRTGLLQHNIETRPLWKPMHLQPVFKEVLYFGGTLAENLFSSGLCLPSGSNLSENDRERIFHAFNKMLA